MKRYLLHRLGSTLVMLLAVSFIAFFLVRLVPGDTVTALLGARYNPERAEALREEYGLDKPLIVQYGLWISHVAVGDFGTSAFTGRPVLSVIGNRLPVTLQLASMALAFALFIGIPFGVISGATKSKFLDSIVTFVGLSGISIPPFWLGTILILVFSLILGLFPSGRFVPLTEDPIRNLQRMILPAISLGAAVTAVVMRMTRASMIEVLGQEYIKAAYAKGRSKTAVVVLHAFKNCLIPVMTISGIQVGYLLAGSVVIEEVFSLPGIGRLSLEAINNRDYALLQGTILFIALMFILVNLAVDLLYGWANPQMRVESEG